jgi:hypothetical protein
VDREKMALIANNFFDKYQETDLFRKNFTSFGFGSFEEAKRAKLGDPYEVKVLGLGDLKIYKPDVQIDTLYKATGIISFPVIVDQKNISRLEIAKIDGDWRPRQLGGVTNTQATALWESANKIRLLAAEKRIEHVTGTKILRIPALHAEFMYFRAGQQEFLIPAMDIPQRFQLENGRVYEAHDVLVKLSAFSQAMDPDKIY